MLIVVSAVYGMLSNLLRPKSVDVAMELQLNTPLSEAQIKEEIDDPSWNGGPISNSLTLGLSIGDSLAGLAATPLSLVNLYGWNLTFPTTTDLFLWRISMIVTILLPGSIVVLAYWRTQLVNSDPERQFKISTKYMWAVHALARVVFITEMFRGLFYLPPAAFITSSAAVLPHVG